MMYPRLALLREFLSEDGAIFISIDENEYQNLRAIMDELFGLRHFVANVIWQKRTSPDMRLSFSTAHDYVLVYGKDIDRVVFNKIPKTAKQAAQFKNPDKDPRGPWVSSDYTAQGYRPNQMYTIRTPGGTEYKPPAGVCWKNVESVFLDLVRDGRIWFGKDGKGMPRRKTVLSESEGNAAWTWWPNEEVGHTQEAKKELDAILGEGHDFETPKPRRLLERVLALSTDKHSFILDSFGGSGTTAHAVLVANKADGGTRRFILVEMEADICQKVTSQRLTRAIQGYESRSSASDSEPTPAPGPTPSLAPSPNPSLRGRGVEGLGGGFRFCKLSHSIFDENGQINAEVRFADLAAHVFFTETGEPIPKRPRRHPHPSSPVKGEGFSPLIGVCNGTAYYLLFNGVLGDKRPDGGNVLTGRILEELPAHDGPKVVYGEGCRLGLARLKRGNITFKQVPYEIKTG
jgi:DNA modification methylase